MNWKKKKTDTVADIRGARPPISGTPVSKQKNNITSGDVMPALEVNVSPLGARMSVLSPMTKGGSIATSTAGSYSTAIESIIETNEQIETMIQADLEEVGDGGDSDEEGDGFHISNDLARPAMDSASEQLMNDRGEIENNVMDSEDHFVMHECEEGTADDVPPTTEGVHATVEGVRALALITPRPHLDGAPDGWLPPAPKEGWEYSRKINKQEPQHATLDNPGQWSSYTYKAKFAGRNGTGPYSHHEMPAGARPVPIDPVTGKRMQGAWEFFYQGWKQTNTTPGLVREGASKDNMFPSNRKAKLDGALLKKMGLTRKRMVEGDALFFYQLIVPICDPAKSGIEGDPRQAFYTDVSDYSTMYAYGHKKLGPNYGHKFLPASAEELLNWDGMVTRNINSNIGSCWNSEQSHQYCELIADTMSFRRWLDIKAVMKLCDYTKETKRGEPGYDPTQKYRKIWDVQVHNLNQFIEKGGLDITVDETTWANASYADMHGRLRGKKVSKGGQHTLCLDARSRYIYGYTPRHNSFKRTAPFTAEGPAEVKRLVDTLNPLIIGQPREESDLRRQIFEEQMCFGMDNHFSGCAVSSHLGERGFKTINTNRRDRLPKDCKKEYFHHVKQVDVNHRSRMARFEQPIVAVKHVHHEEGSGKKSYCVVHVSFQSTGSTNIQSVNALPEVQLYVRDREKGRGEGKRKWGIEMNESRELYLKLYGAVDKIDQMLKDWGIDYICWRWWQAPMKHGKALALCMSWQMYRDCASGEVDPDWKLDKPLTSPQFRLNMGEQMCKYRAVHCNYPGDEHFRATTKTEKKRRGKRKAAEALEQADDGKTRVSYSHYLDAKCPRGKDKVTRLCTGDLDLLKQHLRSMYRTSGSKCQVCAKVCYMKCRLCNKHICFKDGDHQNSVSCSLDYHNDDFFGLVMDDRVSMFGEARKNYKKGPSALEIKNNKAHIRKLKKRFDEDMAGR